VASYSGQSPLWRFVTLQHIQAKLTVVNQKANNKEKEFIETISQFVSLRTVLFGIFFSTENHVKFIMNK
jgi:hypothetical protein